MTLSANILLFSPLHERALGTIHPRGHDAAAPGPHSRFLSLFVLVVADCVHSQCMYAMPRAISFHRLSVFERVRVCVTANDFQVASVATVPAAVAAMAGGDAERWDAILSVRHLLLPCMFSVFHASALSHCRCGSVFCLSCLGAWAASSSVVLCSAGGGQKTATQCAVQAGSHSHPHTETRPSK